MIAISRCEDYRHDVWDVTAGAMLGASVAYFTYRRYYPSLRDRRCHEPYDRAEASSFAGGDGFSKLADDEERLMSGADRDVSSERSEQESSRQVRLDNVPRI